MGCGASSQKNSPVQPGPKPHANPRGSAAEAAATPTAPTTPAATAAGSVPREQPAQNGLVPPVVDTALVAAERAAAAAERVAVASHAALGTATAAGSKDADGSSGAGGGAGLLCQGLGGDLASFAAEALSSTCADLTDALRHVPYAGAVFSTIRVFFTRAQQVRQNQRLFLVLAMQVRSASECLAVQAASDLMLDFTDRSWFVRVMIAPRIAEDAEHVHKLLTVAQQNLDSACMQFLVRHTAGAAAGGGGVGATAVAASQQQEAFAAAQAEMAALVLQLQQLLAAASAVGLALPGLPAAPAAATSTSLPAPLPAFAASASCAAAAGDGAGGSGWGSELDPEEADEEAAEGTQEKRKEGPRRSAAAANSSKSKRADVDDLSDNFATALDLSRPYSAASSAARGTDDGALPLLAGLQAMLARRGPRGKQSAAAASAAPPPPPPRLLAASAAPPPAGPNVLGDIKHQGSGGGDGAGSEVAGSGDADAESLLQQLHALTGLDADEVAKVTEDAIELLECRQDAAAEAATAGQELPPGGAALLQLRRKQQQDACGDSLGQGALQPGAAAAAAAGACAG